MATTLISVDELAAQVDNPAVAIVDCRAVLTDPAGGEQAYLAGHIAGAVFADMDRDLSSAPVPGQTGRHPLPSVAQFSAWLGQQGIDNSTQVVAYDAMGGALAAARLWLMLRWLGHEQVALLDGGWQAWEASGYPTRSGSERRAPCTFTPQPRPDLIVTTDEVTRLLDDPAVLLIDARPAERYVGANETVDPLSGHIPGAVSRPFTANTGDDGRMLPPEQLRASFANLLGARAPAQAVYYCGSGVSAAQGMLAMVHAGLPMPRLYVGSWSEWVTDASRPRATGEQP